MQETQQQCLRCGRTLDISCFGINKQNIKVNGGYSKRCKECARSAERLRYAANKKAIREKQQARRQSMKVKWVQKTCPACGRKIMVKTQKGLCFCSVCGVRLVISGALGGEPGMQVKRANTHGIRLTVVRG